MAWESPNPRPADAPRPPRPSTPPFGGRDLGSTSGSLLLAGFILILISGVLGLVNGIQRLDDDPGREPGLEAAVVLIAGVVALVAAFMVWQGRADHGGIIALICGVIFLVLGPEVAGLLGVLGGILAIVARHAPRSTL